MNTIQIKSPKGGIVDLKVNQQGKSVDYNYTPSNAYLEAHRPTNEQKQYNIQQKVLNSIKAKRQAKFIKDIRPVYPVIAEAVVKMLDKVQISNIGDTIDSSGKVIKQRKMF